MAPITNCLYFYGCLDEEIISALRRMKEPFFLSLSDSEMPSGWMAAALNELSRDREVMLALQCSGFVLRYYRSAIDWGFRLYHRKQVVSAYQCNWSHCTSDEIAQGISFCRIDSDELNIDALESFILRRREPLSNISQEALVLSEVQSDIPVRSKLRNALFLPGQCDDLLDMDPSEVFADELNLLNMDEADFETLLEIYTNQRSVFDMLYPHMIFVSDEG